MSSSLEKAIAKARVANDTRRSTLGSKPAEPKAQSTGIFGILSMFALEHQTLERNKLIPSIDDKAAVAAYKVLRTRVLQRTRSNHWRSFVVTGAGVGEGKTLTACNLAVAIAKEPNQSVFLIDLDLYRPSIADYFGLDVKLGLGDYLLGKAEIEDIIYAPKDLDRIAIIPNRAPVENSSELLVSSRMNALTKWLGERGSSPLLIYDMPPVLACDDVLAFLPSVDALLMVVSEGLTERARLAQAIEMVGDMNLLGVVLNRSRELHKGSAYY